MTWFQDLQPCYYFGEEAATCLRAVGWLDNTALFTEGVCEATVVQRLIEYRENPWQPFGPFSGRHECNLCAAESSPQSYWTKMGHIVGTKRPVGQQVVSNEPGQANATSHSNLFIPGDGVIYVCPEGIIHYVQQHNYLPPREFVNAVLACPPMWSKEYFQAISASGGSFLLEFDAEHVRQIAPELVKPVPPPVVTLEAFQRIHVGMTVKEVEAILGCGNVVRAEASGRLTSDGTLEQSSTAVVDWCEHGRRITITMENGKVVQKGQQRLVGLGED